MLKVIATFVFGIILAENATKDVFTFHTEKMTWMDARAVCARDGGSLASNYNQKEFIDIVKNVRDPVWTGNYYSPWAWLLGCYSYKPSRDHIEIKANQMKECLNHCHNTNYFGLQSKKCFCFDTFEGSSLETFTYCDYECPGNNDERCGGNDAITIYMSNDICYDNSTTWQGTISQTWSGKKCLPWASIDSVTKASAIFFPDGNAENASNYCRSPFGLSRQPWCYISQTEFEDCDIPRCIKAAEDGIYPCMSFKKPKNENFEYTQEDCQNEHFAICTNDHFFFWNHNKETWKNARRRSRWYYNTQFTIKCKSLAGPQIFWLKDEDDADDSHWFGFFREICTDHDTVPNKMPTKCFSVSKAGGNNDTNVEDCDNKYHFICQYMAVTCGESFNNSLNGSFETPGYNTVGYGDFQRCIWKIIVPENHYINVVLDVSVEETHKCNSDILQVFEERYESGVSFCGKATDTYNTTGNHVTIEFKSDGTVNNFRGVQVNWSAVPVPTSPPETSTSKTSMTEKLLSTPTTKVTKMTTVQNAHVDADTDNKTLAVGTLVGMIVGILIGLCLVLGIVLFCAKRRKASKNNESKINGELDSTKNDENTPAIRFGRCNSGNNKRPSSEIYYNTVTESENVDYSLPNKVDEREKAVVINSVSVSYQKNNGKDGCDHQSGGNSDVYNTLHETTKNVYQNHTENVYNHFTDSKEAFDHAMQGKADTENVYNNFSGCKEAFGHTATLTRQADAENVYHHLNDSEETYDHTTISKRQSKAGATVASDSQTYDHLAAANEPTYDVTSK